mmetsp:Transcript_46746/g.122758  ORF Transcript_46746/g.122758 Transcript_46746/m.122758 type:complete len:234 (-) Transcript_46746:802-1503(-)
MRKATARPNARLRPELLCMSTLTFSIVSFALIHTTASSKPVDEGRKKCSGSTQFGRPHRVSQLSTSGMHLSSISSGSGGKQPTSNGRHCNTAPILWEFMQCRERLAALPIHSFCACAVPIPCGISYMNSAGGGGLSSLHICSTLCGDRLLPKRANCPILSLQSLNERYFLPPWRPSSSLAKRWIFSVSRTSRIWYTSAIAFKGTGSFAIGSSSTSKAFVPKLAAIDPTPGSLN